jgi:hypothetical protein
MVNGVSSRVPGQPGLQREILSLKKKKKKKKKAAVISGEEVQAADQEKTLCVGRGEWGGSTGLNSESRGLVSP